jgi:hypothetical protein
MLAVPNHLIEDGTDERLFVVSARGEHLERSRNKVGSLAKVKS